MPAYWVFNVDRMDQNTAAPSTQVGPPESRGDTVRFHHALRATTCYEPSKTRRRATLMQTEYQAALQPTPTSLQS